MTVVHGVDPNVPSDAQRIVAAYLRLVETHMATDAFPARLRDLPHPPQSIRDAFRTSTRTLVATGQMTPELGGYLEAAFVALADYLDDECLLLLREFEEAGASYAADGRSVREKSSTPAWRRLADAGRLAGQIARARSDEAEHLRAEFRSWQSAVPPDLARPMLRTEAR